MHTFCIFDFDHNWAKCSCWCVSQGAGVSPKESAVIKTMWWWAGEDINRLKGPELGRWNVWNCTRICEHPYAHISPYFIHMVRGSAIDQRCLIFKCTQLSRFFIVSVHLQVNMRVFWNQIGCQLPPFSQLHNSDLAVHTNWVFTPQAARASKWTEVILFVCEPAANSGERGAVRFGRWECREELKLGKLYGDELWSDSAATNRNIEVLRLRGFQRTQHCKLWFRPH